LTVACVEDRVLILMESLASAIMVFTDLFGRMYNWRKTPPDILKMEENSAFVTGEKMSLMKKGVKGANS